MEIRRLNQKDYAGRKFTARYQTNGYYEICASEQGKNKKPNLKQTSAPPSGNQPPCKPRLPYPITAVSSSASA